MRVRNTLAFAGFLAVAMVAAGTAFAETPTTIRTTKIGQVLADAKGMTLYTYTKDSAGKSVCNGKCATAWPPLFAAADARAEGHYSIVTRDDGKKQWAYKGLPLYLWVRDKMPGDTTGDKVRNVWDVARP